MTGPNPEKVTMTERTYLSLESDIRKLQLLCNIKFAFYEKFLIHGTDGI